MFLDFLKIARPLRKTLCMCQGYRFSQSWGCQGSGGRGVPVFFLLCQGLVGEERFYFGGLVGEERIFFLLLCYPVWNFPLLSMVLSYLIHGEIDCVPIGMIDTLSIVP